LCSRWRPCHRHNGGGQRSQGRFIRTGATFYLGPKRLLQRILDGCDRNATKVTNELLQRLPRWLLSLDWLGAVCDRRNARSPYRTTLGPAGVSDSFSPMSPGGHHRYCPPGRVFVLRTIARCTARAMLAGGELPLRGRIRRAGLARLPRPSGDPRGRIAGAAW
jgi:hypothetical protein